MDVPLLMQQIGSCIRSCIAGLSPEGGILSTPLDTQVKGYKGIHAFQTISTNTCSMAPEFKNF